MLKISSKRRRTRKEIAAEKQAKANQEQELAAKLEFIAAAEDKLAHYDRLAEQNEQAKAAFEQLQAQGIVDIDDQGNISPSKKKPGSGFQDFDE